MREVIHYSIDEVSPYVNWGYFFHAWQMNGKPQEERDALRGDADRLLREWSGTYRTHAVVGIFPAGSDGDDLMVEGVRLHPRRCASRAHTRDGRGRRRRQKSASGPRR